MYCTLTIARYPKFFGWAGILSMAFFRLPLWYRRTILFWKLMGCGKNGTFDKVPDWRQWSLLEVHEKKISSAPQIPRFIINYWTLFRCEVFTLILEPMEGHGTWDGKEAMGKLPKSSDYEGMVGILTRATIKLGKLKEFWKHVDGVANEMRGAEGFIASVGIGEMPWIKQATFSIWENKQCMKNFAYGMKAHKEVVQKTRQGHWYSEEMFVRFKIVESYGSLNGADPLQRKSYIAPCLSKNT